jgi:hypothetical protein
MSYPTKHGFFCWPELISTDAAKAKDFYAGLFGWSYEDMDMGEYVYSSAKIGDDWPGGIMPKPATMPAEVPSHWGLYFACDDVDVGCAKVKELGGTVAIEPWDIPNVGRIAVISDPTGAFFMLFKAADTPSESPTSYPTKQGFFTWPELVTGNVDKAKAFYTGLFGWDYDEMDMGEFTYTSAKIGEDWIGGLMPMLSTMCAEVQPYWGSYFAVDDVDASAAKVKELGGQVFREPWSVEGVGRVALVGDPTGAAFMLFKPARQG